MRREGEPQPTPSRDVGITFIVLDQSNSAVQLNYCTSQTIYDVLTQISNIKYCHGFENIIERNNSAFILHKRKLRILYKITLARIKPFS